MQSSRQEQRANQDANWQAAPPLPSARPIALTIAGFDPSSGAGITADLKVFAAHRVYGLAAPTAVTVQSTSGVRRVEAVQTTLFQEIIGCLEEDLQIDGIKIGMLANAAIVAEVASFLRRVLVHRPKMFVVLDPVLRSSSGAPLLSEDGLHGLRNELLPMVSCITPNLSELALLLGRAELGRDEIPIAAAELQTLGAQTVLVTGGHLDPPDDYLRTSDGQTCRLPGERVHTRSDHGTGCAFSSALLCSLLQGLLMEEAASAAKRYVAGALREAFPVGRGRGPMHHLFVLESERSP
jgi:hydroxymethylpyrimidine/phosphomethylpyrimidine kinase